MNGDFKNAHGIIGANIHDYLFDPFRIMVCCDIENTEPLPMWVVLHESKDSKKDILSHMI